MNHLFLALCISALHLTDIKGETWNSLHLTYGKYYTVPLTVEGLEEDGYSYVDTDDEHGLDLYTYKDDLRVAIGVDEQGNIAGIRANIIEADIETKAKENNLTVPFDFADNKIYTYGTFMGISVYYTYVLFYEPGSASTQEANSGVLEVEDVYVKLMDGEWGVIPKDECDAPGKGFTKEACVPGMGLHYYYAMSPSFDCTKGQGVFGLYINGSRIGMGLPNNGFQADGADRAWYEQSTSEATRYILPNRAECVSDWVDKYGRISLHIYFVENPESITCPAEGPAC